MSAGPDVVGVFLRWIWWRALLHRGWWLVTSVYLVVDADLSSSQLVIIGVAQGTVGLAFEIPAGAVADALSRKWALVASHMLMGSAMIATGLVTDFGLLVATQMLWGLSWSLASGADVAWITDELDSPTRISVVLMRSGRADLTGAAAGLAGLGALGTLTERSTAMVIAGGAMLVLGCYVALRFREEQFARVPARRWSASWSILARGAAVVRGSRAILLMCAATFLVNGAAASGRLHAKRLVDMGLPWDPVAWFTVLGVLTLLVGAAALRIVQSRVDQAGAPLRAYIAACLAGALGLVALAGAPEELTGSAAVVVVAGIAVPLTRILATIWVNRHTTSEVRATVHSFLAQAEYLGAIVCGLAVAFVAEVAGLSPALVACAALFVLTIVLVGRLGREARSGVAGGRDHVCCETEARLGT